jgi:hypothetical protein
MRRSGAGYSSDEAVTARGAKGADHRRCGRANLQQRLWRDLHRRRG